MILCIETSTSNCSVALCDRQGVIALRNNKGSQSHATELTVFIEEILKDADIKANQLEAIAVSKGPGSYTGLRIGVSTAKGIAFGASIPIIGVETTLSMFYGFLINFNGKYDFVENDIFCPVIDARRMEVYTTIYDAKGDVIKETSSEIITEESYPEKENANRCFLFGDGAQKCVDVLKNNNIIIDTSYSVSASSMCIPSYKKLDNKDFEDVAYFEPFYLKDFIATKPVKDILHTTKPI